MKNLFLVVVALGILVISGGCSFEHSGSTVSPTSVAASPTQTSTPTAPTAPAVPSTSPSLLGTWSSSQAAAPITSTATPTACTNFQWTVSSQTSTTVSGTFSVVCGGSLSIVGTATGQLGNSSSIPITVTGTASGPGVPAACTFTLNGTGVVLDNGNALQISYEGTTCLGPVRGTETLRKATPPAPTPTPTPPDPTPTPAPHPTPDPTPQPPTGGGGGCNVASDGINFNQAGVYNSPQDLASWCMSAKITSVQFTGGAVLVDFSKRDGGGRWPDSPFGDGLGGTIQYTLGMCLNVNGTWDCSAVVQFWYGRDLASTGPPSQIAINWFYDGRWGPLAGRQPADGEDVGLFVCAGNCRNDNIGLNSVIRDRSNVAMVKWSNGGGPFYGF